MSICYEAFADFEKIHPLYIAAYRIISVELLPFRDVRESHAKVASGLQVFIDLLIVYKVSYPFAENVCTPFGCIFTPTLGLTPVF